MPMRLILAGAGAAVLLVATVLTGLYLGSETQRRFEDIDNSWQAVAGESQRRGALLSRIRGHLGYGGIIHNFKNYVLRKEERYLESFSEQLSDFEVAVDDYRRSGASEEELRHLETIETTIREYQGKSELARRAAAENWPPERTDAVVKVDDTEAIKALAALESFWREKNVATTQGIVGAVREGEELVATGFRFLGGLAAVALAIYGLFFLLQRELRGMIGKLSTELTERRVAEMAAKKFQRAVDQSPATIIITNTEGKIEYVNRKFCDLTGYEPSEVMGRTPRILQSGDTVPENYAALRLQLGRGEEWHGTFRNKKKNGESYWAKTVILPLRDDAGKVSQFIGLGEDITERRRAREQMHRAQKIEAVSMLASGVAHDFNNVLTTILGNIHIIRLGTDESRDIDEELDQIEIAAKRARNLVGQIFAFARRQPGDPISVSVEKTLAEVTDLLRASIQPTIELEHRVEEDDLFVEADPTRLHQVIMNLCSNAAEAIGAKGGRIELAAARQRVDNGQLPRVLITVKDDGPGMTAEICGQIFDPFFTTKAAGKGTGLGLSVVANLISDMNALIEVESAPGKGCTFSISLPSAQASTQSEKQGESPQTGTGTVMLIDDEPEVAKTCSKLLRRLGYSVEMFTHPKPAMVAFKEDPNRFDIVVTDLVMPGLSGGDVINQISEIRPDCPVILCSAYEPDSSWTEGSRQRRFIAKPIEPERLARAVAKFTNA